MHKDVIKGHTALRYGRYSLNGQIYHITTTTQNRSPLFNDWHLASIAASTFHHPETIPQSNLLAWVLMPDHVHWLIELGQNQNISTEVKKLKAISALAVNRYRQLHQPVWAKAFYDHALRKEEALIKVARYIVANPLRAGIARKLGDYPFWNAIWL